MRWLPPAVAWAFLLAMVRALAGQESPPKNLNLPPEKVDRLIAQLGDPNYHHRLAAEKQLKDVGEDVLDRLRRESQSNPDHEIRRRSSYLIGAILLSARTSKTLGLEMSVILPGTFPMGLMNLANAGRVDDTHHKVTISKTFLIGMYEVTQGEYTRVMGSNPSFYSIKGEGWPKVEGMPLDRFPVETVTWYDAVMFCNLLSKLDGFPQHYKIEELKREKNTIVSAKVSVASPFGYRLPTEAEWEFACRAGTTTTFHYGNSSTGFESNLRPGPAHGYGAAHAEALERTAKVGSYKPNGFKLFDMHGNVAEWCEDWYDKDYYTVSPATDPPGPASGTHRVLRGGSWMVNESNCRSASRFYQVPGEASSFAGFRIARTP